MQSVLQKSSLNIKSQSLVHPDVFSLLIQLIKRNWKFNIGEQTVSLAQGRFFYDIEIVQARTLGGSQKVISHRV